MTPVTVNAQHLHGEDAHYCGEAMLEGTWIEVSGRSWMTSDGNPAALKYAVRSAVAGLPTDDDVYYVKIGGLGHLVHGSEISERAA
jgi:hypothetical protein